jgi:hypothetical protein
MERIMNKDQPQQKPHETKNSPAAKSPVHAENKTPPNKQPDEAKAKSAWGAEGGKR